jgi:hypothetical protein
MKACIVYFTVYFSSVVLLALGTYSLVFPETVREFYGKDMWTNWHEKKYADAIIRTIGIIYFLFGVLFLFLWHRENIKFHR